MAKKAKLTIKKIKKRDGRIVPFRQEKIAKAIWKAAEAVGVIHIWGFLRLGLFFLNKAISVLLDNSVRVSVGGAFRFFAALRMTSSARRMTELKVAHRWSQLRCWVLHNKATPGGAWGKKVPLYFGWNVRFAPLLGGDFWAGKTISAAPQGG